MTVGLNMCEIIYADRQQKITYFKMCSINDYEKTRRPQNSSLDICYGPRNSDLYNFNQMTKTLESEPEPFISQQKKSLIYIYPYPKPLLFRITQALQKAEIPNRFDAKYPAFLEMCSRFLTYQNWKHKHIQSIDYLTIAGYFYDDETSSVQCFYCGNKIMSISIVNDLFEQHYECSPKCLFIKHVSNIIRSLQVDRSQYDQLEHEQVNVYMHDPIVQNVLSMKYDRAAIYSMVKKRVELTGKNFESVDSVLAAISDSKNLELADYMARKEVQIIINILGNQDIVKDLVIQRLHDKKPFFKDEFELLQTYIKEVVDGM